MVSDTEREKGIYMTHEMLDHIASYGYGVYYVQGTYMIADPLDGPEGFFLMTPTITIAYNEMCEAGLLQDWAV